ncbi:mediator of RNA polymerase II transcription complex subunit 8-domain-containing protein [Hypoxylon sp. NC1633]|nr:mediator of RNA polymerase II transcription complex subunit 8-domain-containing protein [Hypoxylon sp. NC1633]
MESAMGPTKGSLNLTNEELKAVDQTRQRLSQISSSIASLKADVLNSNPLPNLDSLQASADILHKNIESLIDLASEKSELFSRIAVHPSTNFPGRTQEHILLQLVRKKPEPDVATAMDNGRSIGAALVPVYPKTRGAGLGAGTAVRVGGEGASDGNAQQDMLEEEEEGPGKELRMRWRKARKFCNERLMKYVTGEGDDPYTEEEHENGIENVRTGLRSVDEEEEDDDGVMEIDRPPPPPAPGVATQEIDGASLENIMRFASRGDFVTS